MSLAVEVVETLKSVLKAKRLTYADLAKGIGLSEAAVKRAFAEQAFSLKRLEQIANYLQLAPQELLAPSDRKESLAHVLTAEQEALLASNEKLMAFFYLVAARVKLTKIKQRFRFSEKECQRYLLAFDRVGLIRLGANNRFKVLVEQDFYWPKNGVLDQAYGKKIRCDFVSGTFGSEDWEMLASGILADSSLLLIRKRIQQLEEEVREMIRLDTKYHTGKRKNVTLYCGFRPWGLPMIQTYRRG